MDDQGQIKGCYHIRDTALTLALSRAERWSPSYNLGSQIWRSINKQIDQMYKDQIPSAGEAKQQKAPGVGKELQLTGGGVEGQERRTHD